VVHGIQGSPPNWDKIGTRQRNSSLMIRQNNECFLENLFWQSYYAVITDANLISSWDIHNSSKYRTSIYLRITRTPHVLCYIQGRQSKVERGGGGVIHVNTTLDSWKMGIRGEVVYI